MASPSISKPAALEKLIEGTLPERVRAFKEITAIFWVERLVYVTVITISLLLLLLTAVIALIQHRFDDTQKIITESSGGVCVTATVFLLYMWNKALSLILRIHDDKQ